MLRQISLGTLALWVGSILTLGGLAAYFADYATLNLAGFFYGIPVALIGLALKTAELKPVPFSQPTTPEVLAIRERQSTATQTQILQDVTRYRYGQEAHLDEALSFLGLSPTAKERPVLESLREEVTDKGEYTLVMEFDSPLISFDRWQEKREKMEKFFGPDVRVELKQPEEGYVEVALISTVNG
ncbi:MAG TPA: DUF2854 domain-containing protein [Oscillatoriales cyanobacterium M59_W2019_021]|nr:MAG: DUF2854 domain-containing protein [Cyanobacteria bacterium J055]HIK30635.1 DUF2854 domain-containing protein [Oscillatoriales cyanobacterium M4454_W2019_049]HIK52145.1 DUF2854 domain-containing protein [Oscillatoriales cyanobacterium M59_W2019_021]